MLSLVVACNLWPFPLSKKNVSAPEAIECVPPELASVRCLGRGGSEYEACHGDGGEGLDVVFQKRSQD